MPFGEYTNFDDCLSKNSDKDDPSAYCGYIKNQVEEALKRKESREAINKAIEQDPNANEPEGLTTPDAGNQDEEQVQDLTSPQGSSKEADNDQASGDGELSPADPPQDQAEPEANPQDQAKPNQQNATEDDLPTRDDADYKAPEDEFKDERRDEHEGLEYNGESYHRVNAIEFEDEIYTQKDDKEETKEDDIEFEDKDYGKADKDVLELDDNYYKKDTEQAPPMDDIGTDVGQPAPQTAIDVPELNPTTENVIIRESNGKYRKYNVFQAKEIVGAVAMGAGSLARMGAKAGMGVAKSAGKSIAGSIAKKTSGDEEEIAGVNVDHVDSAGKAEFRANNEASEEIRAVEKIIIKEKGKLKFKSVFTEVKKKASKMTQ